MNAWDMIERCGRGQARLAGDTELNAHFRLLEPERPLWTVYYDDTGKVITCLSVKEDRAA